MGINSNSLYTEFGSKADLFNAAIAHYERIGVPRFIGRLERPDASVDTIRDVFRNFASIATVEEVIPGCLIINRATEHAPTLGDSERTTALTSPNAAVEPCAEVVAAARFLAATLVGVFVMLRAQTGFEVIADAVEEALAHLDAPPGPR